MRRVCASHSGFPGAIAGHMDGFGPGLIYRLIAGVSALHNTQLAKTNLKVAACGQASGLVSASNDIDTVL